MTPGQTHPRRRGLNELMESVAAKLAERPDHIAAARVLEEMQADAAKISHKADGVDVHNGQPEVSSSSSSSAIASAALLAGFTHFTNATASAATNHNHKNICIFAVERMGVAP